MARTVVDPAMMAEAHFPGGGWMESVVTAVTVTTTLCNYEGEVKSSPREVMDYALSRLENAAWANKYFARSHVWWA